MSFVHDDPDFDGLLQIVANNRGLGVALVEKDYWVTHTLWALHAAETAHHEQGRAFAFSRMRFLSGRASAE